MKEPDLIRKGRKDACDDLNEVAGKTTGPSTCSNVMHVPDNTIIGDLWEAY